MEKIIYEITLLEKYFPKTFEELILPSRIKRILTETKAKAGYRILLYSSPGTGKTTTSRLLTLGPEYENVYLSGSNDFNIETYRTKVAGFASGMSVMNKQKNIVIDEADNIKNPIQDAFKILLDKSKANFIFITNEFEKMNEAITSRCTCIEYDFAGNDLEEQKKNFINFTLNVCKLENIKYDGPGIKLLFQLNFPDFRHLLVHLQQILDAKENITIETIKQFSESGKQMLDLYGLIENLSLPGKDLYGELTKFKGKEKECFLSLGEPFFLYLNSKSLFEKTLQSAIIISKYYDSYNLSINKFVTFMSCIIELRALFK